MGNVIDYYRYCLPTYLNPSSMPDISLPSKFDPLLGFPNGRKERRLPEVTLEEMIAAKIPERQRDYCADLLIAFKKCVYETGMKYSSSYCGGLKHEYHHCEAEDYKLRLMEYERERRLLERQRRLENSNKQ